MSASVHLPLSVSQNYFKDSSLVAAWMEFCRLSPQDCVLEIGPGKGIITRELLRRCGQVIAVEIDPTLAADLYNRFQPAANLVICQGDFLQTPLPDGPYKVVANVPFSLTSAIVARLTGVANPPQEAFLVLQKQAAEMYLGKPYECMRSILLKPWFEIILLRLFHCDAFTPVPRVEAALLQFHQRRQPLICNAERQQFRDFVVYGFTAWFPTIRDFLSGIFTHRQRARLRRDLHLDYLAPPSHLSFEDWLGLFEAYVKYATPQARIRVAGSEMRLLGQQGTLLKVHRTRPR
jgi:23S rRNA (adenine-N6)-dimethyltransferase